MKPTLALTMSAALALAACGGSDTDEMLRELNRIEANAAAAASDAGNATAAAVDRALLVGRWSDELGCRGVITEFDDDGTLRADGRAGSWALDGSTLTVRANGRTVAMRINYVDSTDLDGTGNSGQRLHSYRCNGAPPQ